MTIRTFTLGTDMGDVKRVAGDSLHRNAAHNPLLLIFWIRGLGEWKLGAVVSLQGRRRELPNTLNHRSKKASWGVAREESIAGTN